MKNQQDLFNTSEIDLLREEISELRISSDSVRKGMFARHDQIKRDLEKIKEIISSLVGINVPAEISQKVITLFDDQIKMQL